MRTHAHLDFLITCGGVCGAVGIDF